MLESTNFWIAVALVLLIALIGRKVWVTATTALDARAEEIRRKLEEAQQLREEAQGAKANYQRLQRDALKEAEAILAHAKEESKRMHQNAEKALEQALARREQLAVEKIQAAEAKALQEVRGQMVDLAISATRKLIENNIDDQTRKRLVTEAIEEIPARLQ